MWRSLVALLVWDQAVGGSNPFTRTIQLGETVLQIVNDPSSELLVYVKDDPVRPAVPAEFRVVNNKFIGALVEDKPQAMVCVALHKDVPEAEEDLYITEEGNVAVFYTIWSYAPGSAAKLIFDVVDYLKDKKPNVNRFITLSPKTEMARKFHLKNGAIVLRENETTINYEYVI